MELPDWAFRTDVLVAGGVAAAGAAYLAIRQLAAGGSNKYDTNMSGKVVLITGANTGIGFEAAKVLAAKGARVIMAGRSPAKIKAAVDKVNAAASGGGSAEELIVDLSDLKSVARAGDLVAKAHPTIDILVNNAGIMYTVGRDRATTKEGFEEQLMTNVVGPALLTSKVLPCIERAEAGRIVNVASEAHRFASSGFLTDLQSKKWQGGGVAYGNSKLANMLQARALNARFVRSGSKARAYSLHPGVVRTELGRNTPTALLVLFGPLLYLFTKTPLQGAQTTLHLCMAPHKDLRGGAYYSDCAEAEYGGPKDLWESDELAERFLEAVEAMATSGKPIESLADA